MRNSPRRICSIGEKIVKEIFAGILIFVAIFAILIFSIGAIITRPADFAEFCGTSLEKSCDAVIAISGGKTATRTSKAVEIFQQGYAKKLIFSGANINPQVLSDARQMLQIAKKAGVEESEILLEENAKNTQQNAEFTAEIIKKNGFKRVILVTSPYHQNRAFLEFRKALEGTNVEIYNAPAEQDSDFSQNWWLTTRGWYLAISEIVGIFRFYIR